ncbi:GLPGLI family protein [Chryseobacterium arachidis]|uniref:GLPGLI family protein n=1 Tax=Chryseobacterium arachidis TaxID=1416778 RepID=UPI003610804D
MFFIHGLAQQQVHVKYYHVRSAIATLAEDLYIKDNNVISIQDSVINFNTAGTGSISAIKPGNKIVTKDYYISKLNGGDIKDFFFTGSFRDTDYFIHDKVTKPVWSIDETKTKKILGYNCLKATANFRGSSVTAYFTKELPYSAGPFKFFGLPGLILDVRENDKNYNMWKAEKVELTVDPKINFTPQFTNYPKTEMRQFIETKEAKQNKEMADLLSKLPPGTQMDTPEPKNRLGLEKIFEWER